MAKKTVVLTCGVESLCRIVSASSIFDSLCAQQGFYMRTKKHKGPPPARADQLRKLSEVLFAEYRKNLAACKFKKDYRALFDAYGRETSQDKTWFLLAVEKKS